jgi:hypothetical protein
MTHPSTTTKLPDARAIADPPLALVSDGIESIYVNWQGPPLSDGVSGGPVVRSILTGGSESMSAIACAEIGNPDYAVKFSPMPKGQARLEVARIYAGPATALPIARRARQLRVRPPDGLHTNVEAAAKLGCSVKTLNAHVASSDLRYVIIGKGTKRPRRMFTDADLDEFITNQTRKDVPCPSTSPRARHTGISTRSGEVIAFTAQPKPQTNVKRKK